MPVTTKENPSGAGLVTHRSHDERLQNAEFCNNPNTTRQDKDSWSFASQDLHQAPIDPLMQQLGGLEQYE